MRWKIYILIKGMIIIIQYNNIKILIVVICVLCQWILHGIYFFRIENTFNLEFKMKIKTILYKQNKIYQQFIWAFAIPPITWSNPGPETHKTTAGFPNYKN